MELSSGRAQLLEQDAQETYLPISPLLDGKITDMRGNMEGRENIANGVHMVGSPVDAGPLTRFHRLNDVIELSSATSGSSSRSPSICSRLLSHVSKRCHICKKPPLTVFSHPLLRCGICRRRYHSDCHNPPVSLHALSPTISLGKWECSRCIKENRKKRTPILSRSLQLYLPDGLPWSDNARAAGPADRGFERSPKRRKVTGLETEAIPAGSTKDSRGHEDTALPASVALTPYMEELAPLCLQDAQHDNQERSDLLEQSSKIGDQTSTVHMVQPVEALKASPCPVENLATGLEFQRTVELLSAKAESDSRLKYLLEVVTSGNVSSSEEEEFMSHVHDLETGKRVPYGVSVCSNHDDEKELRKGGKEIGTKALKHSSQLSHSQSKSSNPFDPQNRELSPPYSPVEGPIHGDYSHARSDVGVQVDIQYLVIPPLEQDSKNKIIVLGNDEESPKFLAHGLDSLDDPQPPTAIPRKTSGKQSVRTNTAQHHSASSAISDRDGYFMASGFNGVCRSSSQPQGRAIPEGSKHSAVSSTAPENFGAHNHRPSQDSRSRKEILAYKKRIKELKEANTESSAEILILRQETGALQTVETDMDREIQRTLRDKAQEIKRFQEIIDKLRSQNKNDIDSLKSALEESFHRLNEASLEIELLKKQLAENDLARSANYERSKQPVNQEELVEPIELQSLRDELAALKQRLASRDDPYPGFKFAYHGLLTACSATEDLEHTSREIKIHNVTDRHSKKETSTKLLANVRGQRGQDPHQELISSRYPTPLIQHEHGNEVYAPKRGRGRPRRSHLKDDKSTTSSKTTSSVSIIIERKARSPGRSRSFPEQIADSDEISESTEQSKDEVEERDVSEEISRRHKKGRFPALHQLLGRFDKAVGIPNNPRPCLDNGNLAMRDGTLDAKGRLPRAKIKHKISQ